MLKVCQSGPGITRKLQSAEPDEINHPNHVEGNLWYPLKEFLFAALLSQTTRHFITSCAYEAKVGMEQVVPIHQETAARW